MDIPAEGKHWGEDKQHFQVKKKVMLTTFGSNSVILSENGWRKTNKDIWVFFSSHLLYSRPNGPFFHLPDNRSKWDRPTISIIRRLAVQFKTMSNCAVGSSNLPVRAAFNCLTLKGQKLSQCVTGRKMLLPIFFFYFFLYLLSTETFVPRLIHKTRTSMFDLIAPRRPSLFPGLFPVSLSVTGDTKRTPSSSLHRTVNSNIADVTDVQL